MICVPTLPKIFRPVTRNTLIFLFGLSKICSDPGAGELGGLNGAFLEG